MIIITINNCIAYDIVRNMVLHIDKYHEQYNTTS